MAAPETFDIGTLALGMFISAIIAYWIAKNETSVKSRIKSLLKL